MVEDRKDKEESKDNGVEAVGRRRRGVRGEGGRRESYSKEDGL